jgi:hypothetical protein
MPDGSSMQSFGYDPTAYVTAATNYANTMWGQGQSQYNWAQNQFNQNEGTANDVVNAAVNQGNVWGNAADAGLSRYEQLYAPAMQQQLQYAQNYASPQNLALYRGQAMAGVGSAFDAQAKAASDSLRSYGLDPQAIQSRLDTTVRTQRAASEAGAGTQSDINTKLVGQQLLSGAIQTGQTDAGLSSQMAGVSQSARNQAVNTGLATTASGSATMGTPTQWSGMAGTQLQQWPSAELGAMNASNQQGSLWNNINQTNLQAQQLAQNSSSGFGAIAGAGLGALSNMVKFAPIALATGGVVPSAANGMVTPQVTGQDTPGGLPAQAPPPAGAIQTGSIVPPSAQVPGIQGPDKVPAMVKAGEGIVPKDVMDWMGEQQFQKMITKSRTDRQKQTVAQGQDKPMPAAAIQTGPTFASQGAVQ